MVCKSQNGYQYSVDEITGATSYIWTVPAGATISGVANEKSIVIDFSPDALSGEITVKGHNTCGEGAESSMTITVNPCTGIQEHKINRSATLYPNPVTEFLNVVINNQEKQLDLILTDINGREVYWGSCQNTVPGLTVKIDVTGLARGLYILRLQSDDLLYTEKIVIQ